jgi:hypothetical protein
MKFLKSYSALIIMVMIISISNTFAQSSNNVPTAATAAFSAKYPTASIKKWNETNNTYVAEARLGSEKFYATFDQSGTWLNTASKISWSWNLPTDVRASLRNSKYAAWRIDGIKKVESPSNGFYQVCVDDRFLHRDGAHADVFTNNKVLNIKANGEIVAVNSISSPLLF